MAIKKRLLKIDGVNNTIAVERLTALWALNECGLGGLMHAFKLPFTGIVVGGISVLFITLIALYASNICSTLLKALTIVLLVKAGVSPYTPIPAYFAVSFQAFLGIVLYSLFSVKSLVIIFFMYHYFLGVYASKIIYLHHRLRKFTLGLIGRLYRMDRKSTILFALHLKQ